MKFLEGYQENINQITENVTNRIQIYSEEVYTNTQQTSTKETLQQIEKNNVRCLYTDY